MDTEIKKWLEGIREYAEESIAAWSKQECKARGRPDLSASCKAHIDAMMKLKTSATSALQGNQIVSA